MEPTASDLGRETLAGAAERWVSPEDVRRHLGFTSIETVCRLCQRGLPHRRIGRTLRFKLSRVDEWVDQQQPRAKTIATHQ